MERFNWTGDGTQRSARVGNLQQLLGWSVKGGDGITRMQGLKSPAGSWNHNRHGAGAMEEMHGNWSCYPSQREKGRNTVAFQFSQLKIPFFSILQSTASLWSTGHTQLEANWVRNAARIKPSVIQNRAGEGKDPIGALTGPGAAQSGLLQEFFSVLYVKCSVLLVPVSA